MGADPSVVVRLATFYQLNVSTHSVYTRTGCSKQVLYFTARPRGLQVSVYDTVVYPGVRWDPGI